MNDLEVRIVQLEPMRVVSVHALSASPEHDAWEKLVAWAKPRGLMDDLETHRVFGFNNPDPSPGSPNYGYEFWILVGPEVDLEDGVEIKEFTGGLYAVTRCKGAERIGETWRQLGSWVEDSRYRWAPHQWLEEHISGADAPEGELILDLCFPISG